RDQQLAHQHLALALRRQGAQQPQEDRDVPERIEDQEQQQRGGNDRHGATASACTPANGAQTRPRYAAPEGDSRVTQASAARAGSTARVSPCSTWARERRPVRIGPGCRPLTRTPERAVSACSIPTSPCWACWARP